MWPKRDATELPKCSLVLIEKEADVRYVSAQPILRDASRRMQCKYQDVFVMACAMTGSQDKPEDLYRYYCQTNTIPEWMQSYLIGELRAKAA